MDPGTTVGLAILDLRGRLLHLSSKKGADDRWVVETISRYGVPVIVATDVKKPPERVAKLAAAFGARLWAPDADLPVQYKDAVARRFSYGKIAPQNDHERDALAAAFAAFSFFAPKFRQVERRLREAGRMEEEDRVKREVVFGQSVDRALRREEKKKKRTAPRKPAAPRPSIPSECPELRERLGRAEETIEELRERIRELEAEIRRAASRREIEIRRDARVARLEREKEALLGKLAERDRRLSEMEARISELQRLLSGIAAGEYVFVGEGEARRLGLRVLWSGEGKALVRREDWEKKDPEAYARRLQRLIDEYRRRRADRI